MKDNEVMLHHVALGDRITSLAPGAADSSIRAYVQTAAATGVLDKLATEPGPFRAMILRAAADAATTILTEENTDAAIDYMMATVKVPRLFGVIPTGDVVRRVLDAMLPGGLHKLLRWLATREG